MFQGVVAPIRLTEEQVQGTRMLVLRRRGPKRGIKCFLGLHRWTDWTDLDGHWAIITRADGVERRRDVLISRRYCPACSGGETMVVL